MATLLLRWLEFSRESEIYCFIANISTKIQYSSPLAMLGEDELLEIDT